MGRRLGSKNRPSEVIEAEKAFKSKNKRKIGRPTKKEQKKYINKKANDGVVLKDKDIIPVIDLDIADDMMNIKVRNIYDHKQFLGNDSMVMRKCMFLEQIIHNKFNLSKTANDLKTHKTVIWKWLRDDIYFSECYDDVREILLDYLEQKAAEIALSGDKFMVAFLLKTLGKERGYVEKIQTEMTKIEPIVINIDEKLNTKIIDK